MLKELFSKLFKNKKKEVRTNAIVSVLDLIDIPPREYLKNKDLLNLIDEYKKEYIKILNSKKHIVHTDFNIGTLKDDMLMNVDLILNVLYGNKIKIYEDFECDDIDILKLKIYQSKLNELEFETIARIVALSEIAEEKKHLMSKHKIDRVLNEIISLKHMFMIFMSQKRAVENETEAYLATHEEKESTEEKLLLKLERVKELARLVIPERLELLEDVEDIKQRIALIERELEIYAYKNKDRAEFINSKIASTVLKFDRQEIIEMPENLNEPINSLEKEMLVFALYGRNLITKEQLTGIYKLKFAILTFNINEHKTCPVNEETNFFELECYKDILMKKIEAVITKKSKVFKGILSNSSPIDIRKHIKLFKEIVSNGGMYDAEKILNDPKILALILAFDYSNSIDSYFKNFKVSKNEYDINYYETVFRWEEDLPLDTIFRLMPYTKNYKYDPLERLYNLHVGRYQDNFLNYYLPEGIIEMVENPMLLLADMGDWYGNWSVEYSDSDYMLDVLKKKMNGKTVVLPESLKVLLAPSFRRNFDFRENRILRMNEWNNPLNYEKILIPSIADIRCLANLEIRNARVIGFYDFENSEILNERKYLQAFVKMVFSHNAIAKLQRLVFYDKNFEIVLELNPYALLMEAQIHSPSLLGARKQDSYYEFICDKIMYMVDQTKQRLEKNNTLKLTKDNK